jgi:ubiquinone/menaquinone biosynthesis C-methylase UbiE
VEDSVKVLKEASRVLKEDGAVILGLILKESSWANFYKKKGEAGNIFIKLQRFTVLKS